jgi:ankyrin repeat protein
MAAANGHAGTLRFLLSKSADPSPKTKEGSNTPLHWACLNGHAEATKVLLEGGASPGALNAAERTPVDEALGGVHQEAILGVMREFAAGGAGKVSDREEEAAAAEAEAEVAAAEGEEMEGEEEEEEEIKKA